MAEFPYNNVLYPLMADFTGPPYTFSDVTTQIFPLQADPVQLANFVDSYLNILPSEVAYFRPIAPYVMLSIFNFGQQAQAPASGGAAFGFMSATQITFTIPLIYYQRQGDHLKVKGIAQTSPFSYTTDPVATLNGRLMFGFPNQLAWFEPSMQTWKYDPNSWDQVATLDMDLFPELWQGDNLEHRTLMSIHQKPRIARAQWPPLHSAEPSGLFSAAAAAITELSRTLGWALSTEVFRHPIHLLWSLIHGNLIGLTRYPPQGGAVSFVSLKQFRDATIQEDCCYQEILSTDIALTHVARTGLLGSSTWPPEDLSGGYRIRLNMYDQQPIISRLGIHVAEWEYDQGGRSRNQRSRITTGVVGNTYLKPLAPPAPPPVNPPGPVAAWLKPIAPFWVEGNIFFQPSQRLAWRLRDSPWFVPDSANGTTSVFQVGAPERQLGTTNPNTIVPRLTGNPYNTTLGPAVANYRGPFQHSDVCAQVLPLRADPVKLQQFCDNYLNFAADPFPPRPDFKSVPHYFEVYGDFVYLFLINYGQMISLTENVGSWNKSDFQFAFPVTWYREGKFLTVGMVAPYTFTNSGINAITHSEVAGFNYQMANFVGPPSIWKDQDRRRETQPLFQLWTSLYPAQSLATRPNDSVLLEVIGESGNENTAGGLDAEDENTKFVDELRRLQFSERNTLTWITLKQFRGAEQMNSAVYQSIVAVPKTFVPSEAVYRHAGDSQEAVDLSVDPIEKPLSLRIYESPELPVVTTLGLKSIRSEVTKPVRPHRLWQGDMVDILKPVNPFRLRFDLRVGASCNVRWRASGEPWWHDEEFADSVHPWPALEKTQINFAEVLKVMLHPESPAPESPRARKSAPESPRAGKSAPRSPVAKKSAAKKSAVKKSAAKKSAAKSTT